LPIAAWLLLAGRGARPFNPHFEVIIGIYGPAAPAQMIATRHNSQAIFHATERLGVGGEHPRNAALPRRGMRFGATAATRPVSVYPEDPRMDTRLVLAILALAAGVAAPARAQVKDRADTSPLALWSAKGTPLIVRQYVPGLNGALLLSNEQIVELYEAWRQTVDHPALLEKGKAVKANPQPSEELLRDLRLAYEAAHGKLQSRVASILKPDQKELMLRLEVLYGQARESVNADLAPELARVKANMLEFDQYLLLEKDRLAAEFVTRVNQILTPDQRAAMEKAALEEKRREAEAAAASKK